MVRGMTDRYTYFLISKAITMVSSSRIENFMKSPVMKSLSRMHKEFCICIRLRISLRPSSLPFTPPHTGTFITCRFTYIGRLPKSSSGDDFQNLIIRQYVWRLRYNSTYTFQDILEVDTLDLMSSLIIQYR